MTDFVVSGGQTSSGVFLNFPDTLTVLSGGTAVTTTVEAGGVETVSSGGVDLAALVSFHGEQRVLSGGTATGDSVNGTQAVFGTTKATTIYGFGFVEVEDGGSAIATTIDSGGREQLDAGATERHAVNMGGLETVFGITTGALVFAAGEQDVGFQGIARNTSVGNGYQVILPGGTAIGTVLSGRFANLLVSSGGSATGTRVLSGGVENVDSGGIAVGTLLSGGNAAVLPGGVARGVVVLAGSEVVDSGGTIIDPVVSGGAAVLELEDGAIVEGGVTLLGSGATLRYDGTTTPDYTISGFVRGDFIELPNLPFDSKGTSTLMPGNVLHIAASGDVINLQLDQNQNFSGDFFSLVPDFSSISSLGSMIIVAPSAPPGGEFVFPFYQVGINNNLGGMGAPIPPFANPNVLNIEVFTELYGGPFPGLYQGYGAAIVDDGGYLDNGLLTGSQLELFAGDYEVIDSMTGSNTPAQVFLGSGNQSVIGAIGDTLIGGVGDQYVAGAAGDMYIAVGSGGSDLIVGSTVTGAGDTITGGAAAAHIAYLGPGDLVDFTQQTGAAGINATAGSSTILLGGGPATVFGGGGDTISFGSVGQYADGTAGDMAIAVGTGGVDSVVGSTVAGSSDTITGGAAALSYNIGSGGDLLNLAGSTGNATINAFTTGGNDTIIAGNGSYSVWGGGGDRIGVGDGPTVGGTDLWGHSTTVPAAAIGFGTNDAVVATSYDSVGGTFSVDSTLPGACSAQVTVGGGAGNFDAAHDFLFYPNESPATDAAIVATAQSADGGTSSLIALPDGTVMTLTGVTPAQLQIALIGGGLFQA